VVVTNSADSDELKTFVASTLKAVAAGISDAQDVTISSAHGTGIFGFSAPELIEFDVAVSAKLSGKAGGGMKVAVFGIGANIGAEEGTENSSISRIRFSIPTNFKNTTPPQPLDLSRQKGGIV
jgi:hypothetical protein